MSASLTTQAPQHNALVNLGLSDLLQLGEVLIGTGFLPAAIKTAQQAVAVMLKGQELRIPPMYALSNIAVIQGKPVANAELMLALIFRDHGDRAIEFIDTNDRVCNLRYKRRNAREYHTHAFTMEQAKQAGLTGNNWSKYPAAMLRARCISAVARLAFPDSIGGMYTPEELDASVDLETGEIEALAPLPAQDAKPRVIVQTGEIIEPDLSEAQLRAGIKSNFRTLQERHWSQERIQGEYAKVITDGTPSTELSREQLLPVYTHFEQLVGGSFVEA